MVGVRLALAADARSPVFDALREGALRPWVEGSEKDIGWYPAAKVWWPNPLVQTFPKKEETSAFDIMIRLADIDSLWSEQSASPSRGGGRPQKWDWAGAMMELAALEVTCGIENKTGPEVQAHLRGWFIDTTGDAPSDSHLKDKIKAFRERMAKT
jgi:hypothetical protein